MAQHGPPARYRADPGRSRLQLLPLPGIFLATVAVAVAFHATHTGVSRRPDCTQLNYHSYRETRLHAHAWRPTSPVCTATSHTLFSHTQHTVAHSPVPHSYSPRSRGHSPAVSHSHVGVRTHVPLSARTWFLPTAVPLLHTACREARTPARSRPHHSHTGFLPHSGSHLHTGTHPHTGTLPHTETHSGSHSHMRTLSHTPLHSRYACVAARVLTHVYTHRDTTHTGTTLVTTHTGTLTLSTTHTGTLTLGVALTPFTAHTGTFTLGTTLTLASTRAPGVFTPPKLRVHPSAALTPSTSRGTTESTWS